MRTLKCIYVNSFNRPGFLTQVIRKMQKMHFFHNLRTINQERNMETRQMTPFFIYFFRSQCLQRFFLVFQNSKNLFSCGPPFDPFLSVKYLNFGQTLPIGTAHHTFLESRHPEVTKNSCYFCSQRVDKKRYQPMDYRCHKHAQQLIQNLACFCHNSGCYVTVSCACIMGLNQTLFRRKT